MFLAKLDEVLMLLRKKTLKLLDGGLKNLLPLCDYKDIYNLLYMIFLFFLLNL